MPDIFFYFFFSGKNYRFWQGEKVQNFSSKKCFFVKFIFINIFFTEI
jgi:hypothetical protein